MVLACSQQLVLPKMGHHHDVLHQNETKSCLVNHSGFPSSWIMIVINCIGWYNPWTNHQPSFTSYIHLYPPSLMLKTPIKWLLFLNLPGLLFGESKVVEPAFPLEAPVLLWAWPRLLRLAAWPPFFHAAGCAETWPDGCPRHPSYWFSNGKGNGLGYCRYHQIPIFSAHQKKVGKWMKMVKSKKSSAKTSCGKKVWACVKLSTR